MYVNGVDVVICIMIVYVILHDVLYTIIVIDIV